MSNDTDELQEYNEQISKGPDRSNWDDNDCEVAVSVASDGWDEFEGAPNDAGAKMWAVYNNTYSPCEKAVSTLPPGQYTIDMSQERGIFFSNKEINLDDLMTLPDSASEEVLAGIETFWSKEDHFREFGFLWKRGVMLWGPPGSGKTSTVQMLSKQIVDKGGLSVYVQNPDIGAKGLELMRRIEPNRPIVVIIEDIDAVAHQYGESDLLALLDGELQIDNVVFIATTNYPERLDKRLTNRPSRFDIVKKIGMPSKAAREVYLKEKNPRLSKTAKFARELSEWVSRTEHFSLAHLKELIISVEVFEVPLDEAITRLRTMMDVDVKSEDGYDGRKIGFK